MKTTRLKSFAVAAALLLVVPSVASAQTAFEVSGDINNPCYLTTFEGAGHGNYTGTIGNDRMTFTFDANWSTVTSGPYANNPSVSTISVMVGANSGEVVFSQPVSKTSLFYASETAVTLTAFDNTGNVVASTNGAANMQPDAFTKWDPISVAVETNSIYKIVFKGLDNATAIDDFQACRTITDPVELLEILISDIADINLAQGISNAVDAKLDAAFAAIIDANQNNDVAACNALDALVHFVEVQWDHGKLTDGDALYLILAVDEIIDLLCPA